MESSLKVLKELRKQRKMTQAELAKIMNVSQGTIAYWENGDREPSYADLKRLADIFRVSTDYLLGRDDVVQRSSLSKEQEKLLNDFKDLNKPNQQIILTTITAFLTQQAAKVFGNVITNNNNGSGSFISNSGDTYNLGA